MCYHKPLLNLKTYLKFKELKKLFIISGGLREISLTMAKELRNLHIKIVPGYKLCPNCRMEFFNRRNKESTAESEATEDDTNIMKDVDCVEQSVAIESSRNTLNCSLDVINVSPFKTHAIPSHYLVSHGKKKLVKRPVKQLRKVLLMYCQWMKTSWKMTQGKKKQFLGAKLTNSID